MRWYRPAHREPAHPPTATADPVHSSPPAAPIPLGAPPDAAGAAGGGPEPAGGWTSADASSLMIDAGPGAARR